MIDRTEKRKRQRAVELQNSREKRSNTGLSVARRSSLPSSGSPQRWSKSASPQLPSGQDNRDVKLRYCYAVRLLRKRRDFGSTQKQLEGFVWSFLSITGKLFRDNLPRNAHFWQVGLLDIVLSEYPDKSHNFRNFIFMTSSLKYSIWPIYTSELSFWEELARINDGNKTEWSLVQFVIQRVIKQCKITPESNVVKVFITVWLKNELEDTKFRCHEIHRKIK